MAVIDRVAIFASLNQAALNLSALKLRWLMINNEVSIIIGYSVTNIVVRLYSVQQVGQTVPLQSYSLKSRQ